MKAPRRAEQGRVVGFFPNSVFGVTDHLLRELDSVFRDKGIRYHRLSQVKADKLVKKALILCGSDDS